MSLSKKVIKQSLYAAILYTVCSLIFDFIQSDFSSPWYYLLEVTLFGSMMAIYFRSIAPSTYPESKQNKESGK